MWYSFNLGETTDECISNSIFETIFE
jgi:hypothetical protein